MNKKIAVTYLVWVPFGIKVYEQFLHSYIKNPAGAEHSLLLLFNGVKSKNETEIFINHTQKLNINFEYLIFESGQDMELYYWTCERLQFDIFLFLNSYSTFNRCNWLKIFIEKFSNNIGLIGASASNQSIYSSVFTQNKIGWCFNQTINQNIGKYKLLIKAFLLWRWWFKKFPCPHIRATAFMIRRSDYLEIKNNFPLRKKIDAYKVECGFESMTNQILKKGLKVGVVNSDGDYYDIKDAIKSNTFRIFNQEKLLINDKQTDWYKNSNDNLKREFTFLAWGV